jgi:hypothetical protein
LKKKLLSLGNMGYGLTALQMGTAAFIFAASEGNNIDTPARKGGSIIF